MGLLEAIEGVLGGVAGQLPEGVAEADVDVDQVDVEIDLTPVAVAIGLLGVIGLGVLLVVAISGEGGG